MNARLVSILLLALATTACSGNSSDIARVTSIPEQAAVSTATPTPILRATVTPLGRDMSVNASVTPYTSVNLPQGNAMLQAQATDAAFQPTPRTPVPFDSFPVALTFDEFYDGYNIRYGLILSDKLTSLDGQQIVMEGYMAPPLKPELDYFVLTRVRLAFCPFCSNASDWPDDIALVYLPNQTTTATQSPVRITGRIEIGASTDAETGMVSLVRIYADRLEILN